MEMPSMHVTYNLQMRGGNRAVRTARLTRLDEIDIVVDSIILPILIARKRSCLGVVCDCAQ